MCFSPVAPLRNVQNGTHCRALLMTDMADYPTSTSLVYPASKANPEMHPPAEAQRRRERPPVYDGKVKSNDRDLMVAPTPDRSCCSSPQRLCASAGLDALDFFSSRPSISQSCPTQCARMPFFSAPLSRARSRSIPDLLVEPFAQT